MSDQITPTAEFVKCIRVLAALYPEFKLTQETTTAYFIVLADIEPALLKAATLHIASQAETNFFPRANLIRKACFELIENENDTPSATDAWGTVLAAVGKFSFYNPPTFDNPLTMKALGGTAGWRAFCMADESDTSYHRHQFIAAYESYLKRERYQFRMLPQVKALAAQYAGTGPALTAGATALQLLKGDER